MKILRSPRCTASATTTSTSTASRCRVADPAALARAVSPRRNGIGSDGLILICPSTVADVPDGDVQRRRQPRRDVRQRHPLRRQVRLRARPRARKPAARRDRRGRSRRSSSTIANGKVRSVDVDMGEPILEPARIPVRFEAGRVDRRAARGRRRDVSRHLRLDGESALRALRRAMSMGSTSKPSARASSITASSRSA